MSGTAESILALLADIPGTTAFIAAGLAACLACAAPLFLWRGATPLRAIRGFVSAWLGRVTAALLLVMVVLSGLQILLRNALESGLLWIDPLLRHLVLLLTFLGAIAATGGKRHLRIDVLGRLLHGVSARAVGALQALLGAAICLALARASFVLLAEEIPTGEIAFPGVPTWCVIAVFPVSFLAMALRMAMLAMEEAAGIAPEPDVEGMPAADGTP